MANAAANGLYPHGREGKNRIAYIEYNVTFPEDVNLGNISVANSVSYINSNRIVKTVNGRTVNFKMYLTMLTGRASIMHILQIRRIQMLIL